MPDFAVRTSYLVGKNQIVPTMGKNTKAVDKFGKHAESSFNRASRAGMGFKTRIRDIAGGIISANILMRGVRAVWDFGKEAINLSSSLIEVQNVVDTTFGTMANSINDFSKTAIRDFGISELQAKQYTGTIGAMIKSSGISGDKMLMMSKNLAGLTGDYASFYNLPHEQAFQKIRSGISGETEPLKQIGINMSVANMEAFALTKGITKQWKAMTQAEQTLLRYNYLMEKSTDAQGDFSKTLATSFENQRRVFQTMVQQTAARAMSKILPSLTEGFKKLNEFVSKIDADKLADGLKKIVDSGIWLIKMLYKLRYIIIGVAAAFGIYKVVLGGVFLYQKIMMAAGWIKYLIMMRKSIWAAIKMTKAWAIVQKIMNVILTANPIGLIIVGIAALIAIIIVAIKYYDKFGAIVLGLMGPVGWFVSALVQIYRRWDRIKEAFTAGGIKAGLLEIGKAILDGILYPFQKIYEMAGKLPGRLGKGFRDQAKSIEDFREKYLGSVKKANKIISRSNEKNKNAIEIISRSNEKNRGAAERNLSPATITRMTSPERRAPNETEVQARQIDFTGRIDIAGAPEGTQVQGKTRGAPAILLQLLGAQ